MDVSSMDTSWIQAGLQNWGSLWPSPARDEELSSSLTDPAPNGKRVGFMRHAPEYWFLTYSILNRMDQKEQKGLDFGNCDFERHATGMAHLSVLVDEFRTQQR